MRVEYTWPFFYTQRGHLADACSGWTEWFSPKHVRKGRAISISSYYMAMAHAISTILSPGAGGASHLGTGHVAGPTHMGACAYPFRVQEVSVLRCPQLWQERGVVRLVAFFVQVVL